MNSELLILTDLDGNDNNCLDYRKVASRSTSWLVARPRIFRPFMKGKFDPYVLCDLWPLTIDLWIVDRSTARDFTVCQDMPALRHFFSQPEISRGWNCLRAGLVLAYLRTGVVSGPDLSWRWLDARAIFSGILLLAEAILNGLDFKIKAPKRDATIQFSGSLVLAKAILNDWISKLRPLKEMPLYKRPTKKADV